MNNLSKLEGALLFIFLINIFKTFQITDVWPLLIVGFLTIIFLDKVLILVLYYQLICHQQQLFGLVF